jgi:hypothetical protein
VKIQPKKRIALEIFDMYSSSLLCEYTFISLSKIIRITESPKLPDQEANMVPVEQDAGLALVIEVGSKVYTTDYMPTTFELLLKSFFNMLGCILEVGDLVLDHLNVYVLRDQQSVVFHVNLHVAELYVGGYLNISRDPVFGNTSSNLLLLLDLSLLSFLLLRRHSNIIKMQHINHLMSDQTHINKSYLSDIGRGEGAVEPYIFSPDLFAASKRSS